MKKLRAAAQAVVDRQNIAVGVRIRPFTDREVARLAAAHEQPDVAWEARDGTMIVQKLGIKEKESTGMSAASLRHRKGDKGRGKGKKDKGIIASYDHVFGPEDGTTAVYDQMCAKIVDGVLDGYCRDCCD